MANAIYDLGREAFAKGQIDWTTNNIYVLPVRTSGGGGGPYYTFSQAHQYLSSVPNNSDCRPVTAQLLDSRTATSGVLDAANELFSSVAAGDAIQAFVIYKLVTVDADSPLLIYLDTGTNLPVTPNGGNIDIQWDDGANKIAKL